MRRLLLLALLLLGACAPRLQPPGPAVTQPAIIGDYFQTRDGLKLPLRTWKPEEDPKAVILALHGFNDYSNAFKDSGAFLSKQGYLVHAYDQRGFGGSPHWGMWAGTDVMAGDLSDMARLLKARYPTKPLILLGESMGGAVIMVAVTGADPPPGDRLILAAPAVWGRATMPWYQRWALAIGSHTVPWMTVTGRGFKRKASDNIPMLRALGADPLVIKETRVDSVYGLVNLMDRAFESAARVDRPTLFLYGAKDEIVPADPSRIVMKALPKVGATQTVALYGTGYHMLLRDLEAEVPLKDIAAWLADPQTALPSGADKSGTRLLAAKSDD